MSSLPTGLPVPNDPQRNHIRALYSNHIGVGSIRERAAAFLRQWSQKVEIQNLSPEEKANMGLDDTITVEEECVWLPKSLPERTGKDIVYFPNVVYSTLLRLDEYAMAGNGQVNSSTCFSGQGLRGHLGYGRCLK